MKAPLPTLCVALLLACTGPSLSAQTFPPKTVPSPRGEQFLFLPSSNLGIGSFPIALDDPLGDPFHNPAVPGDRTLRVSFTPVFYGDKRATVAGRSLPLSVAASGSRLFGTVAVALQRLEDDPRDVFSVPTELESRLEKDPAGSNRYLLGSLGVRLGERTSLGVGAMYGDLEILDGDRRQYPAALWVIQDGEVRTLTVGATHAIGDRHELRATVSNTLFDMSQEVTGWRRPPANPPGTGPLPAEFHTFADATRSQVWEGSVRYTLLFPDNGVRLGAMGSFRKGDETDPPEYDLVHVPRDPAASTSGEVGIGVERIGSFLRLALELAWAPGSAHTLLRADTATASADGSTIQPGDLLVETDFSFNDWRYGMGVDIPIGAGGLQAGLAILGHGFMMDQDDRIRAERNERKIAWKEWIPSLGVRMVFGPVEAGYSIHLTNRGSSPCADHSYRTSCQGVSVPYYYTGLKVAPSHPDDVPDFRVITHQLTLSMPVG